MSESGKRVAGANRRPGVSQQRIASDLGVSQALVSMVLNGRSKGIGRETYRRIWDYAVDVGYKPKGMRIGENGDGSRLSQVGFILRSRLTFYTQSNFFSHVQHGLHAFLEKRGRSSLFLGTEVGLMEKKLRSLSPLRDQVHGVVVMGQVDRAFLGELRRLFPRLVAVSASYPGLCHSVLNNEEQATSLLVDHLASLGHRSFAWIGLGEHHKRERHKRRMEGFLQAVSRRGATCVPDAVGMAEGGDRMDGQTVAARLLERFGRRNLPTAWVGYNGLMARGAVNYLLANQIAVPGEVSVAAVDGTRVCEEESPTLTGAFTDPERMGAVAGEIVMDASGGPDEIFRDVILPAALSVRESTARVARGARAGRTA